MLSRVKHALAGENVSDTRSSAGECGKEFGATLFSASRSRHLRLQKPVTRDCNGRMSITLLRVFR